MLHNIRYHYPFCPPRAETNKLTTWSRTPFGTNWNGSVWAASRYQQVYNASLFAHLPPGGFFIAQMETRPGCGGSTYSYISNLVVRMSTTSRSAGELSPVFDENLGEDTLDVQVRDLVFIDGTLEFRFCENPTASGSLVDRSQLPFRTPYFYDPRKGNLLVEMLIPNHVPTGPKAESAERRLRIEVSRGLEDGMSSIFAPGANPARATETNPFGLVTRFWLGGFPKLEVHPAEDHIALIWPCVPDPARLQYRDEAADDVPWRDHDLSGLLSGGIRLLRLPRSTLPPRRFFRLYWNSPQIGLPDTPIEVTRDMPPTPPQP